MTSFVIQMRQFPTARNVTFRGKSIHNRTVDLTVGEIHLMPNVNFYTTCMQARGFSAFESAEVMYKAVR